MPNPNCSETFASLRIVGPGVDPDAVTAAIGIAPDFRIAVGEALPKTNAPSRNGIWALESKGRIDSRELEEHISVLLGLLAPNFPDAVPPDSRLDVFCYWRSSTGHGGPDLSAAILGRMADFGLDLSMDFYVDV